MSRAAKFQAEALKETMTSEWKEFVNKPLCWRCGGLMVMEEGNHNGYIDPLARRCVHCGELVDPIILWNRRNGLVPRGRKHETIGKPARLSPTRRDPMKKIGLFLMIVLAGLTACSRGGGGGASVQIPVLMSPYDMSNKEAAAKNNEGVDHLVQGHYEVASKHFNEAIAAKEDFAEAHFNLAISYDGMGKHQEATGEFKKAKQFGGNNSKISEDEVLKKHLGM